MSKITLSVLGLYQYDPTILDADHLLLPAGVDRDTLLPLILTESAELEVMYPNPQTLGAVIKAWSTARRPEWERIKTALEAEYNAIHNYDRTEEETSENTDTDTDTGTVTRKKTGTVEVAGSGADTLTKTGTVETAETGTDTFKKTGTEALAKTGTEALAKTGTETQETEQNANGNSTNQVTGYNASTMADKDKTVTNDSRTGESTTTHDTTDTTTHNTTETTTHNTTDTTTHDTTDTTTHNTTETTTKGSKDTQTHNTTDTETRNLSRGRTGEGSRTLHVYGNIGVTTAAQMISGELDIRKTDIYHIITREFVRYFCLLVY